MEQRISVGIICGPPPEVIPNIPLRRNRNGPFHLNSDRNFRNLKIWHNGMHPPFLLVTVMWSVKRREENRFLLLDYFIICGIPSEVLLFFRLKRNGGNFLTICQTFQFTVSHQPKTTTGNRIANGKRHFVGLVY